MNKRIIILSLTALLVAVSLFSGLAAGEKPVSLSFSSCPSSLSFGSSADVYACLLDTNGTRLIDEPIFWRVVSGESITIASDSAYGSHAILVPVSSGVSVISAASLNYPDIFQMTEITVFAEDMPEPADMMDDEPTSLSISSCPSSLPFGSSADVYASLLDANGTKLIDEPIFWRVVSGESVTIESASAYGSHATLVPVSSGVSVISAASVNHPDIFQMTEITVFAEDTPEPETMIHDEPVMFASSVQASGDSVPTYVSLSGYSGLSRIDSDTFGTTLGCVPYLYVSVRDQYGNYLSSEDVDWYTDNESVLTIYPSAADMRRADLTLKGVGTAVITAASKSNASVFYQLSVVVEEPVITSVELSGSPGVSLASTGYLYAYVLDQFGNTLDSENILLTVSDSALLSLTTTEPRSGQEVIITPKETGNATIYAASISNTSITQKITVVIEEPVITSVYLSGRSGVSLGSTVDLYAYVRDQFGSSMRLENIVLSVSDPSLLSLSKTETRSEEWVTITPKATGSVTIQAASRTNPSITQKITVDIEEPVITSVNLYGSSGVSLGSTGYIRAYVQDQFGNVIASENTLLTVSDSAILSIAKTETQSDQEVTITPKAVGTVTIYAASKSTPSITREMTVVIQEPIITSVYLYGRSGISLGSTGYVYAYVRDQFGSTLNSENILLSVSDTAILSIAKTETKPGESVTITPKTIGTVTIKAASKSTPAISKEITVVIQEPRITSVYLYGSSGISLGSTGYIRAYVQDQFGNAIASENTLLTVSDSAILSIAKTETQSDQEVTITPKAVGTVTIYAASKSMPWVIKEMTVVIEEPIITSIEFSGSSGITLGSTGYISASARDQFGNTIRSENILLTVSDAAILSLSKTETTYSQSVTITPKAAGTVTIKAASKSKPAISKEITVVIEEPIITSIYLSGSSGITLGSTGDLYAYVQDQFGNSMRSENIVLSVSDPSLLSLSKTETRSEEWVTITPKATGTVTIKAASKSTPSLTKQITVVIQEPVITSVYLSGSSGISLNSTGYVYAYVQDQFGNSMPSENILLTVSDSAILSIAKT
ncbi:MAG: hypothetical protein M0Q99_10965, partial [Candidatus Cloacimonetes bacterium]|nr:hypothetical protein [Candidatus Cloacimonadota bacterium]